MISPVPDHCLLFTLKKIMLMPLSRNMIFVFLICFPMDYRDFSVKSKVIISLFQTFVLTLIKYHLSLLIRFILAKINCCVSELGHAHLHVI